MGCPDFSIRVVPVHTLPARINACAACRSLARPRSTSKASARTLLIFFPTENHGRTRNVTERPLMVARIGELGDLLQSESLLLERCYAIQSFVDPTSRAP